MKRSASRSGINFMIQHGKQRAKVFTFGGDKFAIKTVYYCAKCEMEVDEFQWKEIHAAHVPTETKGAALELPKVRKAAA